jgi:hypothetical protein
MGNVGGILRQYIKKTGAEPVSKSTYFNNLTPAGLHLVDDLRTWALNTSGYFKIPDFTHEAIRPRREAAA